MRQKLQELVDRWKNMAEAKPLTCGSLAGCASAIESILAAMHPVITVRKCFITKDKAGLLVWIGCSSRPVWLSHSKTGWYPSDPGEGMCYGKEDCVIEDPWPNAEHGGPECWLELK